MQLKIKFGAMILSMAFSSFALADGGFNPFGFFTAPSGNSPNHNQPVGDIGSYQGSDTPHGYNTKGPCLELTPEQAAKKSVYIHINAEQALLVMQMPKTPTSSETAIQTPVSTADLRMAGAVATKHGCFQPHTLDPKHASTEYNGAVMLDSIFFCGGEAIHVDPTSVGSHGCVHVDQAAADRIFETVTYFGKEDTAICID